MNIKESINKYLLFIKGNKYNMYFIAAISVMIVLIISIITIIFSNNSAKKSAAVSPTNSAQGSFKTPSPSSILNISPSTPPLSITTPNPPEAAAIGNQTQPQITPTVAASYTVSNITKYGNTWAVMTINNPAVGEASVIIEKINNSWKVVMGPGTYFPQEDLQSIGAPQELINNY